MRGFCSYNQSPKLFAFKLERLHSMDLSYWVILKETGLSLEEIVPVVLGGDLKHKRDLTQER